MCVRFSGQRRTASAGRRAVQPTPLGPKHAAVSATFASNAESTLNSSIEDRSATATEGRAAAPANSLVSSTTLDSESDPLLDLLGFSPAKVRPGLRKTASHAGQLPGSASSTSTAASDAAPTTGNTASSSAGAVSALQQCLPVVSTLAAASEAAASDGQAQVAAQSGLPLRESQRLAVSGLQSTQPPSSALLMPASMSQLHLPSPALPSLAPSVLPTPALAAAKPELGSTDKGDQQQQLQQLREAEHECTVLKQQLKVQHHAPDVQLTCMRCKLEL